MSGLLRRDRRLIEPELSELVRTIVAAPQDEPETDALEWKGSLELSGRRARSQLARTLVGFGNRRVSLAQRAYGGYAYLVAGAEPGQLLGVDLPDPADLENALNGFVAHGSPGWRLHRVDVSGATVAVLEVAPPQDGDRICCLQTNTEFAPAGRIFVRREGQTCEASPSDVRALEDRYAAQAIALQREAHTLASQQLERDAARDARDELDRAIRDAPRFSSGRMGEGFAHSPPDEVSGLVRNIGGSAGTIIDARLMPEAGGAYPGAGAPIYGSGPTTELGMPVRVDRGGHAVIRFRNPNLSSACEHEGPFTLELSVENDAGVRWRHLLVMRRKGVDSVGRRIWTIRDGESEEHLNS